MVIIFFRKLVASFVFVSLSASVVGCAGKRVAASRGPHGLFQLSDSNSNSNASSLAMRRAPRGERGEPVLRSSGKIEVPKSWGRPSEQGFIWPLSRGQISSYYGRRERDFHDGIDIKGASGMPVYAAREGTVIYSGARIRGYGNLVIIKHIGDYATIYAHNRTNLVHRGEYVRQGQMLALVGATGRATGPHLHFEVRYNEIPQDPLGYLPDYRVRRSIARK